MNRIFSRPVILLLTTLLALPGCAKVIPTAGTRMPSDPARIKLYQRPPHANYEFLGTISLVITPEMKWNENGDSTKSFEVLKAKAAALGANAILFHEEKGHYDYEVGAGYKGVYYRVAIKTGPKTAVAEAIFVQD